MLQFRPNLALVRGNMEMALALDHKGIPNGDLGSVSWDGRRQSLSSSVRTSVGSSVQDIPRDDPGVASFFSFPSIDPIEIITSPCSSSDAVGLWLVLGFASVHLIITKAALLFWKFWANSPSRDDTVANRWSSSCFGTHSNATQACLRA